MTKSVVSTLVGIAIDRRSLEGVDLKLPEVLNYNRSAIPTPARRRSQSGTCSR